jgi:hypothetical protein
MISAAQTRPRFRGIISDGELFSMLRCSPALKRAVPSDAPALHKADKSIASTRWADFRRLMTGAIQ